MKKYPSDIEKKMKAFYKTLSERQKREYAATEAMKLGHGGIAYISRVLECSPNTVSQGVKELKNGAFNLVPEGRNRKPGGGRKPYGYHLKDIDEKFLTVLKDYTAGDPMNENIVWTNLKQQEIADLLFKKYDIRVSRTVIRKLLEKHNYKRRKAQKKACMKEVKNRNEQFENIARLRSEYEKEGDPVISIDTKKKSL